MKKRFFLLFIAPCFFVNAIGATSNKDTQNPQTNPAMVQKLIRENALLQKNLDDASKFKNGGSDVILDDLQKSRFIVATIGTRLADQRNLADFLTSSYKGTEVQIKQEHDSVIVQIPSLIFNYNTRLMPTDTRTLLKPIVQAAVQFGLNFDLYIEGHADTSPLKANSRYHDNWEVGYARSERVAKELVKMNLPQDNLVLSSRGSNTPIGDTLSEANNRRVDFVFQPRRGTDFNPPSIPKGGVSFNSSSAGIQPSPEPTSFKIEPAQSSSLVKPSPVAVSAPPQLSTPQTTPPPVENRVTPAKDPVLPPVITKPSQANPLPTPSNPPTTSNTVSNLPPAIIPPPALESNPSTDPSLPPPPMVEPPVR